MWSWTVQSSVIKRLTRESFFFFPHFSNLMPFPLRFIQIPSPQKVHKLRALAQNRLFNSKNQCSPFQTKLQLCDGCNTVKSGLCSATHTSQGYGQHLFAYIMFVFVFLCIYIYLFILHQAILEDSRMPEDSFFLLSCLSAMFRRFEENNLSEYFRMCLAASEGQISLQVKAWRRGNGEWKQIDKEASLRAAPWPSCSGSMKFLTAFFFFYGLCLLPSPCILLSQTEKDALKRRTFGTEQACLFISKHISPRSHIKDKTLCFHCFLFVDWKASERHSATTSRNSRHHVQIL